MHAYAAAKLMCSSSSLLLRRGTELVKRRSVENLLFSSLRVRRRIVALDSLPLAKDTRLHAERVFLSLSLKGVETEG